MRRGIKPGNMTFNCLQHAYVHTGIRVYSYYTEYRGLRAGQEVFVSKISSLQKHTKQHINRKNSVSRDDDCWVLGIQQRGKRGERVHGGFQHIANTEGIPTIISRVASYLSSLSSLLLSSCWAKLAHGFPSFSYRLLVLLCPKNRGRTLINIQFKWY